MATKIFQRNIARMKGKRNTGEVVKQEVMLCDKVETVHEFTHHDGRVSAGGGCEAAVTARTRCGWVMHRECGKLLHGRFMLTLKSVVYKSYLGQHYVRR